MQVIITRPADDACAWLRQLRATGGWKPGWTARLWPLIGIRALPFSLEAVAAAGRFDAVMFVSPNAVRFGPYAKGPYAKGPYAKGPYANGPDAGAAAGLLAPWVRAWAVGPSTRRALAQAGWPSQAIVSPDEDRPARVRTPAHGAENGAGDGAGNAAEPSGADPAAFDSEALWRLVQPQVRAGAVRRVLLVRGAEPGSNGAPAGREWLGERLAGEGVAVAQIAVYERELPAWTLAQQAAARAALGDGSVWLISSSLGARQLWQLLGGAAVVPEAGGAGTVAAFFGRARAVATHARIAEGLRRQGWGQVLVSPPQPAAVVASIESMDYAR